MNNRVDHLREYVIQNIISNVVLNEKMTASGSGSGSSGNKMGGGNHSFSDGIAGLENDSVFFPSADVRTQQTQQSWLMNNWSRLPSHIQARMLDLLKKKKKTYEY
jgi:hypothetical protein